MTVKKVDKSCIWSEKDKTIRLECSVMLNYQLEIVGEEFVTSIGDSDEFYVDILFDRSIYRPMCTHMGNDEVTLIHGGFNARTGTLEDIRYALNLMLYSIVISIR